MVNLVQELPATGRVSRRPQHPFYLQSRAFALTPFMIAPVLPGETMKNLLLQSRVVTDPIKNPVMGWWKEYYFFYVKHRDLDDRDAYVQMALDPEWDNTTVDVPAGNTHYFSAAQAGVQGWVGKCLKRVTEEYFREEGEAWNNVMIDTDYPSVHINGNSVFDSLIDATSFPDTTLIDEGGTETHGANEMDAAMRQWEFMRSNALTNMTYEDFLATYGVRKSTVELHRPELLRYVREWSYPTNTVNPTDGNPASAVSWAIAERADKDRFFKEPGFIFGVTCARPKVYIDQAGSVSDFLNTAFSWLPAIMKDDPYSSLREFAQGSGPLDATTNGYWVDMRDLFLYGEQFSNIDVQAADGVNTVALPTAGLVNQGYPTDAMSKLFFVDDTTSAYTIREDGVVSLSILGRQVDFT